MLYSKVVSVKLVLSNASYGKRLNFGVIKHSKASLNIIFSIYFVTKNALIIHELISPSHEANRSRV